MGASKLYETYLIDPFVAPNDQLYILYYNLDPVQSYNMRHKEFDVKTASRETTKGDVCFQHAVARKEKRILHTAECAKVCTFSAQLTPFILSS